MTCENCGTELVDNTAFCENCGANVKEQDITEAQANREPVESKQDPAPAGIQVSSNIIRDSNGVMRWIYEFSLWKNPTVLFTIWKVLLIASGFVGMLLFFVTLGEDLPEALRVGLMVFGISAGIITALMLITYPVFCLINGGKYCVLFEMDQKGIKHEQLDKQFEKAKALGLLTAFVGGVSGNLTTAGSGLISAARKSRYTTFSKVRRVTIREKRNVIYIGEALEQNQVYAEAEDFSFICDYILEHCSKNARIRR